MDYFGPLYVPVLKKDVDFFSLASPPGLLYANTIWSRWLREYVPSLNKRVKWHTHSDSTLKTGDLVWVIEPDSLRGYYPLARIVKLNYGQDGCDQSALVYTATREVTRLTVKLAPVLPSSGGGCCNANVSESINLYDWTKMHLKQE